MKWVIRGVIGLVGILLIGGFALSLVSLNDFKPEIESAVEEATGRKLVIAGDLNMASLWCRLWWPLTLVFQMHRVQKGRTW